MLDQTSNRSVTYDRRELFSSLTSCFFNYLFFSSLRCFLNHFQLCQPAILPVQIDVYPSQEDFSKNYKFTFYDINLAAMDITYYKTHEDLLMEMVRQRLLQDFQLVHQAVVMKSRKKTEGKKRNVRSMKKSPSEMSVEKEYPRKRGDAKNSVEDTPAISLSMGHRFQTIQYKPEEDAVRVVIYSRHNAMNIKFKYNFKLWVPTSKQFVTVSQSFDKYPDNINWNALDILICGDSDKSLTERTRYVFQNVLCFFYFLSFTDDKRIFSHMYLGTAAYLFESFQIYSKTSMVNRNI
jgi:hypothetical protein